jgi:hypothetical protein
MRVIVMHKKFAVAFAAVAVLPAAAHAQTFTLADTGHPGRGAGWTFSLQDAGQVAGTSVVPDDYLLRAQPHDKGTIGQFGILGGNPTQGFSMDDAGPFLAGGPAGANAYRIFIHSNGKLIEIGALGGADAYSGRANDLSHPVGSSIVANGGEQGSVNSNSNSAATKAGTPGGAYSGTDTGTDLGSVAGAASTGVTFIPTGSTDGLGTVAGVSIIAGGPANSLFYSNGTVVDLGTLGNSFTAGSSANNSGEVVGVGTLAGDAIGSASVYSAGFTTEIGARGGADSNGNAGSEVGQIVANSPVLGAAGNQSFLFNDGKSNGANIVVTPPTSGSSKPASAIKPFAGITGWGLSAGIVRAPAVAPALGAVPEPATWLLLLGGFGAVGGALRRTRRISTTVRFA